MSNEWPAMPPVMTPDTEDTGEQRSPNTRLYTLISAATVVVIGLVAVATTGMISFSSDDSVAIEQVGYTNAAPPDPVFEPAFTEGDDAFFPLAVQLASYVADTGNQPPSVEDIETGLFGGTAEETCDPERLIDFLMENPDKGQAWAQAQGIDFTEIPSYIESLQVRVLAAPAIVLNHGFDEDTGTAYEVESEFATGTAVLVDADGHIRARCYCGNPVKPKPAQHRPPRCLAFGSLIYVAPGGTDTKEADTQAVVLTGRTAQVEDQDWTEIAWGTPGTGTGWVENDTLSRSLCPDAEAQEAANAIADLVATDEAPTPTVEPEPTTTPPPEPTATPRPEPTATPRPAPTSTPPPQPTTPPAPQPTAAPIATAVPTPEPTPTTPPVTEPLKIICSITKVDVVIGEETRFEATHEPDSVALTYTFSSGSGEVATGNPVTVSYNRTGNFLVSLSATNSEGVEVRSGQLCGTVEVTHEETTPGIGTIELRCSISKTQASKWDDPVVITAWSVPSVSVSWVIHHGDGYEDLRNPSNAYYDPGVYQPFAMGTYQGETVRVPCGTVTVT